MRIAILAISLLISGCATGKRHADGPSPLPVRIVASTSDTGHVIVRITNRSNQTLQYAWPLLVGSQDSQPVFCPLPMELEFHIHKLKAHESIRLKFAGHVGAGYVGLWLAPTPRNGGEMWRMQFSDNTIIAPATPTRQ